LSYEAYSTDDFDKALRGLPKGETKRVSDAISERLCKDPRHNTKLISASYRGLRSFRIGSTRVIFLIVGAIRAMGLENRAAHLDCEGLPDRAIKLLFVGLREDVYEWSP